MSSFWMTRGDKRKTGDAALVLLIKFVLLLIIFQISFSFNLLVASHQNFGRQNFFSLAMATKMVAAWSAVIIIYVFTCQVNVGLGLPQCKNLWNFSLFCGYCLVRFRYVDFFSLSVTGSYVPVKTKLQYPPRQPPGYLNFWNIFVQIPPSLAWKAVQMPHPHFPLGEECGLISRTAAGNRA